MTIGDRIRSARENLNMTKEELASRIGVKAPAIYKYENGLVVNLKRDVIQRLADALEVSPTYLLGFEDVETFNSSLENLTEKECELISRYRTAAPHIQKAIETLLGMGI